MRLDHDSLFKQLLSAFFGDFLAWTAPELAAALDPKSLTFLDKESFGDLVDPDRREADFVVQARFRETPATVLIHLEHQAQVDRTLDRRMFRYFARFYDRYDLPIYPIALCSYPRPRTAAQDYHTVHLLQRTVLDFRYHMLQLNHLEWRDFVTTTNPVAMALMSRMHIHPRERWKVKAASLRLIAGASLRGTQRRLLSQFVDLYLPLQAHQEAAFQAAVATFAPAEQEAVMEMMTSWERKGRAEGRVEGQVELLERLLMRKVGPLPVTAMSRLQTLTIAQLGALGEALLDFHAVADLDAWLATMPETEA